MTATALDPPRTERPPAPLPQGPSAATTLVLMASAAVYIVWGSTYLAIRIAIESLFSLILAGLRHITVGLLLYPVLRRKTGINPPAANWKAAVITEGMLLS